MDYAQAFAQGATGIDPAAMQPQQMMAQQAPVVPERGGPIEIRYRSADGQMETISSNGLRGYLQQAGYNPVGMSADGQTITFQDEQGLYDVDAREVLKEFGHEPLAVIPIGANEDNVNLMHRYGISLLPDDDSKRAFLESKMRREMGTPDVKVTGTGRDWFVFDPTNQRWNAITNKSDWDASDAVEALPAVVKGLAGGIGGALGGGAGFFGGAGAGSIPGAMLGAGAGAAGADALMRGGTALADEDFRNATSFADQAGEVGKEALVSGGTAGLMGGAAKYGPQMLSKVLSHGPASTVARGAGAGAEWVGNTVGKGAQFVADSPTLTEMATFASPALGQMNLAAWLMKLPREIVLALPKLMNRVATSPTAENVLGKEMTQAAGRASEEMFARTVPMGAGERFATRFGSNTMGPNPLRSEDVLQGLGRQAGGLFRKDPVEAAEKELANQIERGVFADRAAAEEAWNAASSGVRDFTPQETEALESVLAASGRQEAANAAAQATGERVGRTAGRGVETLGEAGELLRKASVAPIKLGLEAASYGGRAAGKAGGALKQAGAFGQPLENFIYGRAAADYATPHPTPLIRYFEPWQDLERKRTINSTLATR